MTELGIIASVVQIADVGLRLSIKLYTFGEIVASADRSVISISKDVSLTSGVLKELGQILDKDRETGTFSETAVQTADGVVKECLEVFKEMENILVKELPSLGAPGKKGGRGERVKRATVMLERLKWGYLQPKLELLRSNLDRLKSTLLLMLNVITYARQVAERTELPSVIAEQKCLIEYLAHSNQEYVRKFEELRLGIEGPAGGPVDDVSRSGVVERESSNITKSLSGTLTRKFKRMRSAFAWTSLQDKENTRGLGSEENNTVTGLSSKAPSRMTGSLTTPPNADTNNVFINTSVQSKLGMPPVPNRRIPITKVPMGFEQEVLFKQLEHYSMLIKNLLKEVDEAQYKIAFKSRLRMKGGIAGLHEEERRELEKMWGFTALQSAEQRLDSLTDEIGELPRVNRFAASVVSTKASPYMADYTGTSRLFEDAPFVDNPNRRPSVFDPMPEEINTSAMSQSVSIPPSTHAGDTTHRTDLLSENPSHISVHPGLRKNSRALPAAIGETRNNTAKLKPAVYNMPAQSSPSRRMGRAEELEAETEERRKSSTISMRKGTGDRIGGYTEPHQQEDDTAVSGPSRHASAGKQSEAIWKPRTDSAAPQQMVPQRMVLPRIIYHPMVRQQMSPQQMVPQQQILEPARLDSPEGSDVGPLMHAAKSDSEPQVPVPFQPQSDQGDSQLADMELVDRLVSLWTTVKP